MAANDSTRFSGDSTGVLVTVLPSSFFLAFFFLFLSQHVFMASIFLLLLHDKLVYDVAFFFGTVRIFAALKGLFLSFIKPISLLFTCILSIHLSSRVRLKLESIFVFSFIREGMKQLLCNISSLFHAHGAHMVCQLARQKANQPLTVSAIYTTPVTFKPAHRHSDSSDPLFASEQAKVKQE